MAISFVAAGTVVTGSNPSVPPPAGIAAFDLLILVTVGTATPGATPTGWTQVAAQGAGQFITVYYKISLTGTESNVTVTTIGASGKAVMLAYRGSGSYDVVSSFTTATATTLATATQTTRLNNDYVLSIYGSAIVGSSNLFTAPGSTTTRAVSNSSSTAKGLLIVDEAKATAGITTARTVTVSNSTTLAAVSVSIREPQTLYWTGTGNWSSTTLWKTSSGGATTIGTPTQNDNVVFDINSTSCTINSASACADITIDSSFAGTFAGTSSLSIAGNYTDNGSTPATYSYSGAVTFIATSTKTITLGGMSVTKGSVTFNGVGGNWSTIGGAINGFSTSAICTLTAGTLTNVTFDGGTFVSSGTGTRAINACVFYARAASGTVININTTNLTTTGQSYYYNEPSVAGTRTITLGSGYTEANAPILQCTLNNTDALTITATSLYDLNLYPLAGSTVANTALTIYGSLNLAGSAGTLTAGANAWTFAGTSTGNFITTSGVTLDFPITFDGVGGTWSLLDALTLGSTRTVTLNNGTLSLGSNNLTTGQLTSTGTGTRTIAFGGGQIYLTDTTATSLWNSTNATNLTITGTNPTVNATGAASGAGTRAFIFGSTAEANAINLNVTAGTDLVSCSGTGFKNINLTGFSGTFVNVARTLYGNLTISTGTTVAAGTNTTTFAATSGTKTITSNGKTLDFPITFDGIGGTWQLVDALTSGATRTITLNNGTLNLNGFNITCGFFVGSNTVSTKAIAFSNGQFYITGTTTATVWTYVNGTPNVTGTNPVVNITGAAAAGITRSIFNNGGTAGTISFNISAGAGTVSSGTATYTNLNFTGFTGAFTASTGITLLGSLTLATGMTWTAGTGTITFNGSSGAQLVTSNGRTLDVPITIGTGTSVQLQDALTMGATRTLTLSLGTLDLNNNNITCGLFSSSGTSARTITSGTGQFYLTGNAGTIWTTATPTNLTYTTTPTVNATYSGATGTRTINSAATGGIVATQGINLNVTAGSDAVSLSLPSIFNNIDFTGYTGTSAIFGYVTGNITYSSTQTAATTNTLYVSGILGGTQTVTTNGVTVDTPINFGVRTAAVTAATGDGTTATLTFPSTTVLPFAVGSTIQVVGMTPTGYNGTYTVTASTATTVSYANTTTAALVTGGYVFAGTGTATYTLNGAITLGSTRAATLSSGTLNLATYNLTCNSFVSNIAGNRSITTTGGQLYSANTTGGTLFNMPDATNYTQTGQVVMNFTGAASAVTRGFTFGGTAGGTEANAPSLVVSNGSDAILINYPGHMDDLTFTSGFTGTFIARTTLYGNLSIAAGVTSTAGGDGNPITMGATSGTKTITTNGCVIEQPFYINGIGGTFQLADNFSIGDSRQLRLYGGTFDANGFNVTTGSFNGSPTTSTRSLIMGSGTWTVRGSGTVWSIPVTTGLTFSGASSTINLQDTSTTARVFAGGTGLTYGNLVFSGSNICTTTFQYTNTWGTWSSTKAVAFTITITSGSGVITQTVSDWTISGSAGNLVTLNSSTPGSQGYLSKASGVVNVSYMDIKDSNAAGGATWNAPTTSGNVDSGNNTGWIFAGGALTAAIVEAMSAGDAYDAAVLFYASTVENLSALDIEATQANFNSDRTENTTVADTESVQLTAAGSITENSGLADTEAAQLTATSAITENSGLADTEAAQANFNSAKVENTTLADAESVQASFNSSITENTTIADSASGYFIFTVSVEEPLSSAESQLTVNLITAVITENFGTADTSSNTVAFSTAVVEALSAGDTNISSFVFAVANTENFGAGDTQSAALTASAAIVEALAAADIQAAANVFNATNLENFGAGDSVSVFKQLSSAVTENVGLLDIQSVLKALYATSIENYSPADTSSTQATFNSPAIVEALGLADAESAQTNMSVQAVENTGLADSQTAARTLIAAITEALASADSSTRYVTFSASMLENMDVQDFLSARADFNAIALENLQAADLQVGYGWFKIVDDQIADWGVINNTNANVWATIINNQAANWSNINNAQSTTWVNIGDDQNPNWVEINDSQP